MKIAISLETTRVLRDTWHSAINHEWYQWLAEHELIPLICHGQYHVRDYDMIVLCGGNDMPGIRTWRDNNYPVRDQFESQLLSAAIAHGKPVIGICRGSHFINVQRGGTVRLMEQPYDAVEITLPQFTVTCHHTICVDQLAPGFEILARDQAGVIELARDPVNRLLQVGWHPERSVNAHTRSYIWDIMQSL